ncbi:hypothetical protein SAMN05518801_102131 [Novosphingobium sp. CF614]|uniref:hypothetical protein n=1 Tax=Novosphingobium sp. CF614 TaxID=1884364 RepID=UPI0008F2A2DD|nr:hypothetical protein [Novosphingobium sp. CF614]SFF84175.1 hypothetical protein SAMN05518801_102131 [Novosphingobium sp. CF614]
MKVADKNMIGLEHGPDGAIDLDRGMVAGTVYASQRSGQRSGDGQTEHDARGLIVAIVLCMGCWAALGFFLLS